MKKQHLLFISLTIACLTSYSQTKTNKANSEYTFTIIKSLDVTPVQNQNQSSTCWSFSSLSFFESEIARMGKGKDFNFS